MILGIILGCCAVFCFVKFAVHSPSLGPVEATRNFVDTLSSIDPYLICFSVVSPWVIYKLWGERSNSFIDGFFGLFDSLPVYFQIVVTILFAIPPVALISELAIGSQANPRITVQLSDGRIGKIPAKAFDAAKMRRL